MKTKRVIIYRDGVEPAVVTRLVNGMCGGAIENPRPDLQGRFIITDIVSASMMSVIIGSNAVGFGICAVVEVVPEVQQQEEISTFLGISEEVMHAAHT